jgi:hypothetical protein
VVLGTAQPVQIFFLEKKKTSHDKISKFISKQRRDCKQHDS